MYSTIIQKIDILNIVFAILATATLIMNEFAFLEALLIIASTVTLFITKHRYNKVFIFLTYTCSVFFFGLLFSRAADSFLLNSMTIPTNIAIVLLVAVIIGGISAFANFGSNTLSVVWLTLHLLMFVASVQMSTHISFISALWSNNAQLYTIREYYPFLIAGMLIGVFLEKYQVEMKKDHRNR